MFPSIQDLETSLNALRPKFSVFHHSSASSAAPTRPDQARISEEAEITELMQKVAEELDRRDRRMEVVAVLMESDGVMAVG